MRVFVLFWAFVLGSGAATSVVTGDEPRDAPLGQLIESFADLGRLEHSNSDAPALIDLQTWHESTPAETMRVAWMMGPSMRAQNRTSIRLSDGDSQSHHFVYSWAVQGDFRKHLRPERLIAIKNILTDMPDGIGSVKDTRDAVLISFHEDGKSRTVAYQRTNLPGKILRLCLLAGIAIDIAPLESPAAKP